MQIWKKCWVRYAVLGVLAIACTATMADARRFFRFWWRQPPAAAIENTNFAGDAKRARVRTICIADGELTSNIRATLEDGTFTASVVDGKLMIDPISLSGSTTEETTTTTTQLDIPMIEADLFQTYFSSIFRATADATVTTTVDVDDTPGEPVEKTVPIFIFGSIHAHDGDGAYHLRAGIRGFLREEGDTEICYTLLRVKLNGNGDIPTDEVPTIPPEEE